MTLGLIPFAWEPVVDPEHPSVGFVESKVFDPSDWRPDYPNPAFDDRTERDIRWGARIVAGFSDEMIRTAVAAGRYSDPRAADYVTRVLIERRDKLVRRWLGRNFTQGDRNPMTARCMRTGRSELRLRRDDRRPPRRASRAAPASDASATSRRRWRR